MVLGGVSDGVGVTVAIAGGAFAAASAAARDRSLSSIFADLALETLTHHLRFLHLIPGFRHGCQFPAFKRVKI